MIKDILQIGDIRLIQNSNDIPLPLNHSSLQLISDLRDTLESTGDLGVGLSSPQIGENKNIFVCLRVDIQEYLKAQNKDNSLHQTILSKNWGLFEKDTDLNTFVKNEEIIDKLKNKEKLSHKYMNLYLKDIYRYLLQVYINPKIIDISTELTLFWEGCLSIGVKEEGLYYPIERARQVILTAFDINGKLFTVTFTDFMAHVILHEYDHLQGKLFIDYVEDKSKLWKSKDLDEYYKKFKKYPEV